MQKKQILYTVAIALAASIGTYAVAEKVTEKQDYSFQQGTSPVVQADYASTGPDFQNAASKAIPAVVHINTARAGRTFSQPMFDPFDFFGGSRQQYYQAPPSVGSGSGVIIDAMGYIVTNNHVVSDADKIQVTLSNNKEYDAKVIGRDPSTDIAVIKIDASNLPTLAFENSDHVSIGQWVLAVGYPLNLDATVTAGIVSAKSRNLGINSRQSNNAIESFIQTDAAVNPGNSGGALVNTNGGLIGINSAIASPTGSYAGYSYAIPSNIARKIVKDIIQYGEVKRGYLGVYYQSLDPQTNQELGLASNEQGVYVAEVIQGGAADKAGLKEGDIIQKIGNSLIKSEPVFREKIATLEQGKPAEITIKRNGRILTKTVTPSGEIGKTNRNASTTPPSRNQSSRMAENGDWFEGVEMRDMSPSECKKLDISGGVKVKSLNSRSKLNGMLNEGFIITKINGEPVASAKELEKIAAHSDGIELEGVYEDQRGNYYIQIR